MKFFKYEKNDFLTKKHFETSKKKQSKFKYFNFLDLFYFLQQVATNQLTEVQ